jgi:hypothetical protein
LLANIQPRRTVSASKLRRPPGDGIQKAEISGARRLWGKRVAVDEDDDIGCRNFLKRAGATAARAVPSGWREAVRPALAQGEARTSDKPNFIIIFRGDLGCGDVNYTGNRRPAGRVTTPTPSGINKINPTEYMP